MAQLMTPTVSLTGGDANLIKAPQQDVDVGSTLKATDNTPSIYQLGAKIAEGIYQYEAARESYVALDAQNKRDLEHSQIIEEMQNDKGDWTPEKHNAYKTKIEEVADNYQSVIDGLSPLTQAAARQKSKQHSVEITDQFYKTSRKKQYDFELKTISASLTLEADKLYNLRNDPKKFAEQFQNVMDAYDNLSELSGISKGSAIYNEQKLKTSSSAIYQVVSSLIGTEELSRARQYRKAYDKSLTAEDRGRLDIQLFNLQEKLRKEAEMEARRAAAEKAKVDKVAQEEAKIAERWLIGRPTELERARVIQERLLAYAKQLYEEEKKEKDPQGNFKEDKDFLSLLTQKDEYEIVKRVDAEIEQNRNRFDQQQLSVNFLVDLVTKTQAASDPKEMTQYDTFESTLKRLVAAGAVKPEDSNKIYAMYQNLTPSNRERLDSLISGTPLTSNAQSLLNWQSMSNEVLMYQIGSMVYPYEVLTKEQGLSLPDARKVMARYESAKQYGQEKKVSSLARQFATSFVVMKGNNLDKVYDIDYPKLTKPAEQKLFKQIITNAVQDFFYKEVEERYQAQGADVKKSREDIAAEIMVTPALFAKKYQSAITRVSEEASKNFDESWW